MSAPESAPGFVARDYVQVGAWSCSYQRQLTADEPVLHPTTTTPFPRWYPKFIRDSVFVLRPPPPPPPPPPAHQTCLLLRAGSDPRPRPRLHYWIFRDISRLVRRFVAQSVLPSFNLVPPFLMLLSNLLIFEPSLACAFLPSPPPHRCLSLFSMD